MALFILPSSKANIKKKREKIDYFGISSLPPGSLFLF
jgi:hypothetical protein